MLKNKNLSMVISGDKISLTTFKEFNQQTLDTYDKSIISNNSDMVLDILINAELSELSDRALIWNIKGSSKKLGYLTHNYFRFFGKFPPPIATFLIK